ncbi:hypothetical protein K7I13_09165 [Brucepastera parasyntrophica]|uniref:hypothetical protein n=1 Tax=Brucepastera parasyntrophica TaxID=2880008 RepID=UPI0021091691|nr:hypothetical protein [Brucepastera parasyntrophica]ULQ58721.1 hypothetical protein K7I13_09165 [Brucepastera parasyntrophica]
MSCDKAFDRYLSLDKHERVPFTVSLHLLICPVCRTSVRQITRAEALLARPLKMKAVSEIMVSEASADPIILAAMEQLKKAGLAYPSLGDDSRVSLFRWVVSGIVLAFGFAMVPFTFIGDWFIRTFGNTYLIPFYLLCGIAVAIYCGLFVATNIDIFVKKFDIDQPV